MALNAREGDQSCGDPEIEINLATLKLIEKELCEKVVEVRRVSDKAKEIA